MPGDDGAEALMTAAELRPLLKLSRRRPVSCAIGMTKDRTALVLLDRRLKPRKLMMELRSQGRRAGLDTSTVRFGRASTAGGSDAKVVTFTVNKDAPGAIRLALLVQLRPAGFQRCEIVVDEAIETELEDEDEYAGEDDEAGAIPAPGPGEDDPGEDADADEAPPPVAERATPEQVRPEQARPEPARPEPARPEPARPEQVAAEKALRQDLLGLVREIIPVLRQEPQRKAELLGLANTSQSELRSGDLTHATETIGSLRAALHPDTADQTDGAGPEGGPAGPSTR